MLKYILGVISILISFSAIAAGGSVLLEQSASGGSRNTYRITGYVGRATVLPLLVDTGASVTMLPKHLISPDDYYGECERQVFNTSNGRVTACTYMVRVLRIGNIEFRNFKASILETETSRNYGLLGMNLLSKVDVFMGNGIMLIKEP